MSDEAVVVYSVNEVAELLGVSVDVIQKMMRERRIPHVELGPRSRVVPAESLRRWLIEEADWSFNRPPADGTGPR